MDIKALHQHMAQYNAWKSQLDERLTRFESWSKKFGISTSASSKSLRHARKLLESEHFTVACVGEFSRGKTELINALLYSDTFFGRLLPSLPGRTTMCPTEIFWDEKQPSNCVRLLPIETRRSAASLQNFKKIPQNWHTIPFDPIDPHSLSEAINQVSATKLVSFEEAEKLGFDANDFDISHGKVSIPTWRHALLNLDHPLLREGLRIVDTPGLNALGNEPELTLKTLPDAQAVLFLLAADSGVSASDMKIWHEHIQCLQDDNGTAVLALLNKIDALWDDVTAPATITANIEKVRQHTAKHLQLSSEHVLPISAKQALMAKAHSQDEAFTRSNFPQLEQRLAECIMRSQQQIVGHRLVSDSYDTIVNAYTGLTRQIAVAESSYLELKESESTDFESDVIKQREKIRKVHHHHHKQSLSLRTSQRLLENQRSTLKAPIKEAQLQQLIDETQERLADSWTTLGISRSISDFFDDVDGNMNSLLREVESANKVLTTIYERPEHDFTDTSVVAKHKLNITKQLRQMNNLQIKANHFRLSLNSVFSTKPVVIKRFLSTLVQETRDCYDKIHDAIDVWIEEALTPLIQQNQFQKQLLEHHMLNLTELQQNSSSRTEQLQRLAKSIKKSRLAKQALKPMYQEITAEPIVKGPSTAQVISLQQVRQAQSGG